MKCRLTFQGGHGMHEDASDKYMSIVVDVPEDVAKMCKEYGSTYSHVIATEWLDPYQVGHGIEKQPAVMRWIPTEGKLPEDNITVLVTLSSIDNGTFVTVAWRDNNAWKFYADDDIHADAEVVAWMPLPENYKEKEEK